MKKVLLLLFVSIAIHSTTFSQNFQWAKRIGGINDDFGNGIAIDGSGNVYTVGTFSGTVDFDPGPGVFNITSIGPTNDIFISKLDATGNFVWAKDIGGASSFDITTGSIKTDVYGNVYVIGAFSGTVDFDPGVDTLILTAASTDVFVEKLDNSGNFLWAKQMGGYSATCSGSSIAIDYFGNIYITGGFQFTVDFDPGPGTFYLTSDPLYNYNSAFVEKLSASGNFIWAKAFRSAGSACIGSSIAVDGVGDVYTTGEFYGTVDFDPDTSTFDLNSLYNDIYISKLDSSGHFIWAKQIGGTNSDFGYAITIDVAGNVYTTGMFQGTANFNPDTGTYNLTSAGSADIFVSKLGATGNFVWAKQIGGSGDDYANSITKDAAGNIYLTGLFQGTVDFDPGSGTYNLTSLGTSGIFIEKLDTSGNFVWANQISGATSSGVGRSITVDSSNNVYTTGGFTGTADFDPGTGIYNLTSAGNDDVFIEKLSQCIIPPAITGVTTVCPSLTTTLGNATTGGTWTSSNTAVATVGSVTGIVTGVAGGTSTISYSIGSCYATSTVTITSGPAAITPSSSISVCTGSTTTLADATSGGSWGSNNTSIATVGITGLVTGVAIGTATITYALASSCAATKTVTVNSCGPTIAIASIGEVDSWQRAKNSYTVQVKAATSDLTSWQIVAHDVSGPNPDQYSPLTASGSTETWYFDFEFPTSTIQYSVKSSSGAMTNLPTTYQTKIIDSQWVDKNVVYYNDPTRELKIPFRNNPGTTSVSYSFKRVSNSWAESYVSTATDIISSGSVPLSNQYLTFIHSTLQDLNPGVFACNIIYNGTPYSESDTFDLTKIGYVNSILGGTNIEYNKIVVLVGGINDFIESYINHLAIVPSEAARIAMSWSIADDLVLDNHAPGGTNYNTWYIATVNVNSVQKNAYDIGIALDSIVQFSQQPPFSVTSPDLNIIAHSKGGLETRIMFEGFGIPLSGTENFLPQTYFNPSSFVPFLSSITFVGTPHRGTNSAMLELLIDHNCELALGAKDLYVGSPVINQLTSTYPSNIPSAVTIGNITGYGYNSESLSSSIFSWGDDGVVYLSSSDTPYISSHTNNVNQFQYYYHDDGTVPEDLHDPLHVFLNRSDVLDDGVNICGGSSSLIDKICKIINGSIGIDLSCTVPTPSHFPIWLGGSILPDATINIKQVGESSYSILGITDENGILNTDAIFNLSIGDSIMIAAPGYDSLIVGIDSNNISTRKLVVSMLKSSATTTKVEYAALSLVNHSLITSSNTISIQASGQNVLSYQINSPLNQDTSFVPLTLIGGTFTTNLDTGYNLIFVRFIGASDTVTLSKGVYYLPGSFMNQYAYNVTVNCDSQSLATNLYINNQFVKQITSLHDTIPVFIGQNAIKFTKFGYVDSLITVDLAATINISLQLIPISYSSPTDSNIINFVTGGKIQYRANVTVLDSAMRSIISLKQYDDSVGFAALALKPQCREFEMRHLNTNWSNIKFSAALDQIANFSEDSTYLLKIDNDTSFTKIAFDSITNIAAYDSAVQKLTYNYVNFDSGTAAIENLAIMKKQPPIVDSIGIVSIIENDSLRIPLSTLFSNPDSTHNEMSYSLVSATPTGLSLSIVGSNLIIHTNHCYTGNTSFSMNTTHDWLTRSDTVSVHVISNTGVIAGAANICTGVTTALSDTAMGGTWSSTGTSIATVGSATGTVTGIASGSTAITYTLASGCTVTDTINVHISPTAITGTANVCPSSIITLGETTTGGVWSSGSTGIATVGTGTGIVTGVSTGLAVITYALGTGCAKTMTVTVNPLPTTPAAIIGSAAVCPGGGVLLHDATTGGVWSSGITAIATVGSTGSVEGVAAGVTPISYTETNSCGSAVATVTMTVNPLPVTPGVITGTMTVCAGSTTTLSDGISGGTWVSGTTTVATVSGGGVVKGITSGTTMISYTNANSCGSPFVTAIVTVNPLPSAITGSMNVCQGATTTLSDLTTDGTWSSNTATVATVGSATGIVTGVIAGTDTVAYTLLTGCKVATVVTANPLPLPLTGTAHVCAGSTTTLDDLTTGGAWNSSITTIATVGSETGVVTGVAAGTDAIAYTLPTGCNRAIAVTVNLLAAAGAISGSINVCVDSIITLMDAATGGVWNSPDPTIGIGSTSGVVTGMSAGTATVSYSVTNICNTATVMTMVTINPLPIVGAINGIDSVCMGDSILLGDSVIGGAWAAIIGNTMVSSGGVVIGVTPGIDTISYTVSTATCGSAVAFLPLYVLSDIECNTEVHSINNKEIAELKIYPNPNDGLFTVNLLSDIDEKVQIIITNVVGQKVKEFTTATNKAIDIKLNHAIGVYTLSAITIDGRYVTKIIVE